MTKPTLMMMKMTTKIMLTKNKKIEPPDDESVILDIEYQESMAILANSFSTENLPLDNHNYPDFGNQISNTYYEQDYNLFHEEGESFGGMRGVCWRSCYKLKLYDVGRVAYMEDAKFMSNSTNLLMKSTTSSNILFYEILSELTERMNEDFDSGNPHIRIP